MFPCYFWKQSLLRLFPFHLYTSVCVGPGLEITIDSVRDFVCPTSILSVPKWKEEGLCSVKFCFPKLLM